MKHLTDEQLSARLDGALAGRAADEVERHLAACELCREALAELAAGDESLKTALAHDPGEAYFESFASRVEARIGAAGAAPNRSGGRFDPGRFFRAPKSLAWAGGIAVVVVGGGLALMTGREVLPPDLRDRDVAARVERKDARDQANMAREMDGPPALEKKTAAEGLAATAGKSGSFSRPPAAAKRRADALEPSAGSPVPAPAAAAPTPSASLDARQTAPSRAVEVRRNEAGEDVPVRREPESRIAPPPSAAPDAADRPSQVRKKQAAAPLDAARESSPTPGSGAADAGIEIEATRRRVPITSTLGIAPRTDVQADGRLCGLVRDGAGRPVAGAQVTLTALGRTATTDAGGRFCLNAPRGGHALSVMALGYQTSRRTVGVTGTESVVDLTLAVVPVLGESGMSTGGRLMSRTSPVEPAAAPEGGVPAPSDTLRRAAPEALRLEADAAARPSAARYDMAAGAWERALRRLAGGSLELETRRRLSAARFRAWELDPDSRRAAAAVEALTAYATRAPAGPERDQAVRWLNRVSP